MTAAGFRRLALEMPGASESAHMSHPDFRARGKIFATLGYPDKAWGMVKLTPEQQRAFVESDPAAFVPVKGAWGERGCTNVRLSKAREAIVQEAIAAACGNIPKERGRKAKD
jgi:hypothetical protein